MYVCGQSWYCNDTPNPVEHGIPSPPKSRSWRKKVNNFSHSVSALQALIMYLSWILPVKKKERNFRIIFKWFFAFSRLHVSKVCFTPPCFICHAVVGNYNKALRVLKCHLFVIWKIHKESVVTGNLAAKTCLTSWSGTGDGWSNRPTQNVNIQIDHGLKWDCGWTAVISDRSIRDWHDSSLPVDIMRPIWLL